MHLDSAPARSPGRAAASGARKLLIGQALRGISQLAGVVILSRILEPAIFGVAAIAAVLVGLGELIRDAGLTTAAMREPTLSEGSRSGLFWLNLALGLVCGGLIVVFAPLVVDFANLEISPLAIQVLASVFVVNGLAAQYRADLLRTMRFLPVAIADGLGAVVGLCIAIGIALLGGGYWALIGQIIAAPIIASIWVIAANPWLPRGLASIRNAIPFLRFGLGVTLSQVLGYLGNNVDVIALSVRSTATSLGVYNRAFQIVMAPTTMVQLPIHNSLIPALGQLRERGAGYERLVGRAQLAVGLTIVPLPAVIAATAPGLVPLALGPGWGGAVSVVWLLCGAAALQALSSVANWLFISDGRGARLASYSLISLVLKVLLIVPVASMGATAVAVAYLLATLVLWPTAIFWASWRNGVHGGRLLARSAFLFAVYLLVALVGAYLSTQAANAVGSVFAGLSVAVVVYAGLLLSRRIREVLLSLVRRTSTE